jgi:hypothetical protein
VDKCTPTAAVTMKHVATWGEAVTGMFASLDERRRSVVGVAVLELVGDESGVATLVLQHGVCTGFATASGSLPREFSTALAQATEPEEASVQMSHRARWGQGAVARREHDRRAGHEARLAADHPVPGSCSCPPCLDDVPYGPWRVPWPSACDVAHTHCHHRDIAQLGEVQLAAELLVVVATLASIRPRIVERELLRKRRRRLHAVRDQRGRAPRIEVE